MGILFDFGKKIRTLLILLRVKSLNRSFLAHQTEFLYDRGKLPCGEMKVKLGEKIRN